MSDETLNRGNAEFEHEDLNAGSIIAFLVGLGGFALVVHLALTLMFGVMEKSQKAHQPPQNPLVKTTEADTRKVLPDEPGKFPQPRLETDEVGQLNGQRQREEEILNSYGWVDEKAGVARIPIERAMALVAERGLPAAAAAAAPAAGSGKKAAREKMPAASGSRKKSARSRG